MVYSNPELQSAKVAQSLRATQSEPMPQKAKAVKNRAEADAVMRPLVSSNSSITYDPLGRMVKIVDPGPVTRQFVYSGNTLCEERDGSGNVTKQFFDWGEIINGTKYFYTRNHEGSVTEMTDSSGNVVAQYQYDPFGNVTRIKGSGPDSDFLYAGYFYHQPSGLYITAHRVYNPKLGRWLNRDPIDDPTFAMMPQAPEPDGPTTALMASSLGQGQPMVPNPTTMTIQMVSKDPMIQAQVAKAMHATPSQVAALGKPQTNPYAYVANNPVNLRDPSGLDADWAWCAAYCNLHAKGALAWIICMEECLRGFPPNCNPSR